MKRFPIWVLLLASSYVLWAYATPIQNVLNQIEVVENREDSLYADVARAMARYGYNIIMLRDCTTGVEFPDTLNDLMVTEISIREIEQQFGFTVSNVDFFAGCGRIITTEGTIT